MRGGRGRDREGRGRGREGRGRARVPPIGCPAPPRAAAFIEVPAPVQHSTLPSTNGSAPCAARPPAPAMATIQQLVGRWHLVESKGFDDYMKELGEASGRAAPATWHACGRFVPGPRPPPSARHRAVPRGSRRGEQGARLQPRDRDVPPRAQPSRRLILHAARRMASGPSASAPSPGPSRTSSRPLCAAPRVSPFLSPPPS